MEKKKKFGIPVALGIGSTWFASHCGAGFASGTQEVAFFLSHTWYSAFLPFVSMGILAIAYYITLELTREFDIRNYRQWSDKIYSPYQKVFSIVWEICYLAVGFIATSACLAAGGELLLQKLGIPYYIGIVIVFVIVTLICMYGAKAVIAASTTMSVCLIIMVVIVTILGIASGWDNTKQAIANKVIYTSSGEAIWRMFVYAGYQCTFIGTLVAVSETVVTKSNSRNSAIVGWLINAVMLTLVCVMLMGYMPAVKTEALPTLYVVDHVGSPVIQILYSVILFVALVSTAVCCVYGPTKKFSMQFKFGTEKSRSAVVCITYMILALALSTVGLLTLVQKGYYYVGIANIPFTICAAIFIGAYKLKKKRAANEEAAA
jgi:uncharacterized membrane protein YkvI